MERDDEPNPPDWERVAGLEVERDGVEGRGAAFDREGVDERLEAPLERDGATERFVDGVVRGVARDGLADRGVGLALRAAGGVKRALTLDREGVVGATTLRR